MSDAQQHVRRAQNDLAQARQATNDPLAALHPQARRVDQVCFVFFNKYVFF